MKTLAFALAITCLGAGYASAQPPVSPSGADRGATVLRYSELDLTRERAPGPWSAGTNSPTHAFCGPEPRQISLAEHARYGACVREAADAAVRRGQRAAGHGRLSGRRRSVSGWPTAEPARWGATGASAGPARRLPSGGVQPDVEHAGRVGERAHADHVPRRCRRWARTVSRLTPPEASSTARPAARRTASARSSRPKLSSITTSGARTSGPPQVGRGCRSPPRPSSGGRPPPWPGARFADRATGRDVVVLDQDRIIQAEAVVDSRRRSARRTFPWARRPGVVLRVSAIIAPAPSTGVDIGPGQGGDAGQMAEQLSPTRSALSRARALASHPGQLLAGADAGAVLGTALKSAEGSSAAMARRAQARPETTPAFARHEYRPQPGLGGYAGLGGDVAGPPEVLGQGRIDDGGDQQSGRGSVIGGVASRRGRR